MTEVEQDDAELALAVLKRHKAGAAFRIIRSDMQEATPAITDRRVNAALDALLRAHCIVETAPLTWRVITPTPSTKALASLPRNTEAIVNGQHYASTQTLSNVGLRGLSASVYTRLVAHPSEDRTAAIAKALRKPINQVSAVLGTLQKRGYVAKRRIKGAGRGFCYTALAPRSSGAGEPPPAISLPDNVPQLRESVETHNTLDAELDLIKAISRLVEDALERRVSLMRVRNALEFVIGRFADAPGTHERERT